jgi:hypothetical protein
MYTTILAEYLSVKGEETTTKIITIKNQDLVVHQDLQRSFTLSIVGSAESREVGFDGIVLDQSLDELGFGNRTAIFEASDKPEVLAGVVGGRLVKNIISTND